MITTLFTQGIDHSFYGKPSEFIELAYFVQLHYNVSMFHLNLVLKCKAYYYLLVNRGFKHFIQSQ